MGTFAEFKCKCGYEAYGKWGFGMNPIYREQGISLAPALCRDCRELVSINENAVLLHCPSCKGINVVLYSDASLGQVRKKSVIRSRPVHMDPVPDDHPEPVDDAQPDHPDDDDEEWDLDDLLDIEIEEEEDYICGVDTTYYLCPKCNRFTLEKGFCGLFD
jgi:phage FluMu protein Com